MLSPSCFDPAHPLISLLTMSPLYRFARFLILLNLSNPTSSLFTPSVPLSCTAKLTAAGVAGVNLLRYHHQLNKKEPSETWKGAQADYRAKWAGHVVENKVSVREEG